MTSALPVLDDAQLARADRAARAWHGPSGVPVPIGSNAHKEFFCRMLLDTVNPHKPAIVDWPKLNEAERRRLVSLPI